MNIININVKPLSINKCWQGRRFKTKAYKQYESALLHLLPDIEIQYKDSLSIEIDFGFSNITSDIDNPLKPILDILQKRFGFNDRDIYELKVKKKLTKKKEEYILIKIKDYENN